MKKNEDVLSKHEFLFLTFFAAVDLLEKPILTNKQTGSKFNTAFFLQLFFLHPPSLFQAECTTVPLKAYAFDLCANKWAETNKTQFTGDFQDIWWSYFSK